MEKIDLLCRMKLIADEISCATNIAQYVENKEVYLESTLNSVLKRLVAEIKYAGGVL
jgi:hypothetical protein